MRVVIGEDEALLRHGLVLLLEQAGHEVVGEAANADVLVPLVDAVLPDLLITDIRMPPRRSDDGLLAAIEVRARHPGTSVVVLSQHVQRSYARELLARCSTGIGYLLKQRVSDVTQFLADLEAVRGGAVVLDPEVVELALSRARREQVGLERLTERQHAVLALMAQGRSNAWIARALFIWRRRSSCTRPTSTPRSSCPSAATTTAGCSPSSGCSADDLLSRAVARPGT